MEPGRLHVTADLDIHFLAPAKPGTLYGRGTAVKVGRSLAFAEASIEDYAERHAAQGEFWDGMNGRQGGDPAKLAQALLTITDQGQPPLRFIAGADAIAQAEDKLAERRQQIDAHRELSSSLAIDEVTP